jgi:hypothetical protein
MPLRLAELSTLRAVYRVLSVPALRRAGIRCALSASWHFFYPQLRAALTPGRVPVTSVDHPLDQRVTFEPRRVKVYLTFIVFWIRAVAFLTITYGRRAEREAADFVDAMGRLYAFADDVYARNLSTTQRPRYFARPRFLLIHAFDPHLMCVPSLHVMVVIRTYTTFRSIVSRLGDAENSAPRIRELLDGAREITETILFVKQHSINCIPAALYAMTRFDYELFDESEAERFTDSLFRDRSLAPADGSALREHIRSLYRQFIDAGRMSGEWQTPLLDFLRALPLKSAVRRRV